jgi:UDP-N-acetylglucosamine-lysosomal-enzyme
MNDDIFFGQEVWPNDFYDESVGQKVYFSWPLPDCAPGCPNSWINDGYCDLVCNTTNCMHDGGDCFGDNPAMGFGGDNSVAFHWDYTGDYTLACADGCLDPWLADGFCDDSCNVAECGYDVGDCGYSRYAYLFQGPKINISRETINITEWTFSLPPGTTVAFWDLSDLFATASEMGLVPTEHHDVRAVGLSDQHHFLTVVLHSNISEAYLNVTLQGRSRDGANALIFRLGIRCNTSNHHPKLEEPFEEDIAVAYERLPDAVENARSGDFEIDLSEVDVLKLNLSREALQSLQMIDDQLADDEITAKGFKVKRTALLQPFVRRFVVNGGKLSDLEEDDNEFEAHQIRLGGDLNTNAGNRKLMDAYGDSLLHVHKLYTKKYGYVDRMGISHMPHLIDKAIFVEMKGKYEKEWEVTSGNVMRKSNDMQFAFSYFHYLANEKEVFDIHRVFREYDTDATGTWSDREIRTLLTRIHSLPLDLEQINSFEKTIIDCATNMSNMGIELPSPKTMSQLYERYYDSKLPLVSEFLIVYCEPLVAFLRFSLKDAKKYKHTIIDDAEKSIAFRTISSNISQVVSVLDNLRKEPRKFLCLNDDTDPNEETGNKMVHAVLVDYLESVLPVPSSFELPQHYKNKFLYTFELSRWQLYRSILTVTTYLSVMLLIVIVIAGYFKVDIDAKVAAFGRFLVTSWLYVNRRRYDQNHIGVVQEPQGYSV